MSSTTRSKQDTQKTNRLLPLIGLEHAVVSAILLCVGIVLVVKAHTDVTNDVTRLAAHLGINPSNNGIQGLLGSAKKLTSNVHR